MKLVLETVRLRRMEGWTRQGGGRIFYCLIVVRFIFLDLEENSKLLILHISQFKVQITMTLMSIVTNPLLAFTP